jgi:hypothetical protein
MGPTKIPRLPDDPAPCVARRCRYRKTRIGRDGFCFVGPTACRSPPPDCASAMERFRLHRRHSRPTPPGPPRLKPVLRGPVLALALLMMPALISIAVPHGPAQAQRPEASPSPRATQGAAERRALRLRAVRNWGYWLNSFFRPAARRNLHPACERQTPAGCQSACGTETAIPAQVIELIR